MLLSELPMRYEKDRFHYAAPPSCRCWRLCSAGRLNISGRARLMEDLKGYSSSRATSR